MPASAIGAHDPVPRGTRGGALGLDDELRVHHVRVSAPRARRAPEVPDVAHLSRVPESAASRPRCLDASG